MTSDSGRLLWTGVAVLLWLALVAVVVWREARARRQVRQGLAAPETDQSVLVAFASQTGFGEDLASMTAETLRRGGLSARVAPLTRSTPGRSRPAGAPC